MHWRKYHPVIQLNSCTLFMQIIKEKIILDTFICFTSVFITSTALFQKYICIHRGSLSALASFSSLVYVPFRLVSAVLKLYVWDPVSCDQPPRWWYFLGQTSYSLVAGLLTGHIQERDRSVLRQRPSLNCLQSATRKALRSQRELPGLALL